MKREHSPGEGIAEPTREEYSSLVDSIGLLLEQGRQEAFQAVNFILVRTYWSIGRRIVDFEQGGKEKSEYGSALLGKLSGDLKFRYGKGFSRSNLYLMRELYIKYPKILTLSGKLRWSHYSELLQSHLPDKKLLEEKLRVAMDGG